MTREHEQELQRILSVYTSRFVDPFDYELAEENLYALIGKIEDAARCQGTSESV